MKKRSNNNNYWKLIFRRRFVINCLNSTTAATKWWRHFFLTGVESVTEEPGFVSSSRGSMELEKWKQNQFAGRKAALLKILNRDELEQWDDIGSTKIYFDHTEMKWKIMFQVYFFYSLMVFKSIHPLTNFSLGGHVRYGSLVNFINVYSFEYVAFAFLCHCMVFKIFTQTKFEFSCD